MSPPQLVCPAAVAPPPAHQGSPLPLGVVLRGRLQRSPDDFWRYGVDLGPLSSLLLRQTACEGRDGAFRRGSLDCSLA